MLPTVLAIERQIVRRVAEHSNRDPAELESELRAADEDLPLLACDVEPVLAHLEADFDVALPRGSALTARLEYVRELALLIQGQMLALAARGAA